jgi:hypothetical protein
MELWHQAKVALAVVAAFDLVSRKIEIARVSRVGGEIWK